MANVTDADQERAAELAYALDISCEDFTGGAADVLVKQLALHREETERAVVAWLREQEMVRIAKIGSPFSAGGRGYDIGRGTSYGHAISAIEAREHRK